MNIVSTQFTLEHNSFDIYLSGCKGQPKCEGCHNKELWDFNVGKPYQAWLPKIIEKIKTFDSLIDNIMILGGEPLDQSLDDLLTLLKQLKTVNKKIWLFTRYALIDIPVEVVKHVDYIKTGRYMPELKTSDNIQYKIPLASSNQTIFKVTH